MAIGDSQNLLHAHFHYSYHIVILIALYGRQTGSGEFVFVIDRSYSMYGARFENVKRALARFLELIPENSYFNFISFGWGYDSLKRLHIL